MKWFRCKVAVLLWRLAKRIDYEAVRPHIEFGKAAVVPAPEKQPANGWIGAGTSMKISVRMSGDIQ